MRIILSADGGGDCSCIGVLLGSEFHLCARKYNDCPGLFGCMNLG